jgi:hypothetical protein
VGVAQNLAAKALRKLAGPHLPASLKQLEQAIAPITLTPREEHVDVDEEPVNDGEDDAVDDEIELAHDD